nr:hypothetical protein [Tanacetum cinerariifolium]
MPIAKPDMFSSNSTRVVSSSNVSRPESKSNNLKKRVSLHTKSKSTSKEFKKLQSSVSLVSNERNTLDSNVIESKTYVLNAKVVNVVNDGLSLSKKGLVTSPIAAKSSNLGTTPVVEKSRFSVVTPPPPPPPPPKATNKGRREKSLSSRKSHDTGASYVME